MTESIQTPTEFNEGVFKNFADWQELSLRGGHSRKTLTLETNFFVLKSHGGFFITLFGNDYEIYANWRRTGYPVLTPTDYPGNVTGGQMFRRFSLPNSESLTNQSNYLDALQRQGFAELNGDNLLTKVWWDK